MSTNLKNDFSIINKAKTNKLIDELIKAKYKQPSKLQALTLLTNMHAVYYSLTHMKKYIKSEESLKKYKRALFIKNEKFQLEIFTNEKL